MPDTQETLILCAWQVDGGSKLGFPATEIREAYRTRLAKRMRVYKNGAKLDDTGEDAIAWEVDSEWLNGSSDPSAESAPDEQYPDAVDTFINALRVHKTGDLTLMTRGSVRARLESYRRVDRREARNMCTLTMTFLADSEDSIDAASFFAPAASSGMSVAIQAAGDFCNAAGASPSLMGQLADLAGELQGLAQSPGDFVDQIQAQANAVIAMVSLVEKSFADTRNRADGEAAKLLTDPTHAPALRALRQVSDLASKSALEASSAGVGASRVISRSYKTDYSIFDIATLESQDPGKLMSMNGGLPFLSIPAGTPIKLIDRGA